jgi:hypothetical protein
MPWIVISMWICITLYTMYLEFMKMPPQRFPFTVGIFSAATILIIMLRQEPAVIIIAAMVGYVGIFAFVTMPDSEREHLVRRLP